MKPPLYRCKDCKHFGFGYSAYGQVNQRAVYFAKPKENKGYTKPEIITRKRYYVAYPYKYPCEMFEMK